MAVVIKLNGEYVGVTHMSKSEIRSAESAGFTVIEASETYEQVDKDMENGLGSALRKLYKGCNGEVKYAKYKTKRDS